MATAHPLPPQAVPDPLPMDFREPAPTLAHVYRRRIAFENIATPMEALALADGSLGASADDQAAGADLAGLLRVRRSGPQPWRRWRLAEHVFLYSDPAHAGPRSLVVGLADNALRLMLPPAVVLQRIAADAFDLVLLRDPQLRQYTQGIAGYAPDLAAVCARVAADIGIGRYRSVHCMGPSGGGAAALVAGRLLGAEVTLSVAAAGTDEAIDQLVLLLARHAPLRTPVGLPRGVPPQALNAYGDAHERDARTQATLERLLPGCSGLPLPGITQHNCMHELLKRGELGTFLRRYLLTLPGRTPDDRPR